MSVLKRILLLMLVSCTLGYSSAWAFDGHAFELAGDVPAIIDMAAASDVNTQSLNDHASEHGSEHQSAAGSGCDHSCHISVHLLAIFPQNDYTCSINQSSQLLELPEDFTSFIVSPDLRPPRV